MFLHGSFEIGNQVVIGIAAEGLLPKWFDKSPTKGPQEEIADLLLVIRQAVAFAHEIQPSTAFEFWRQLYSAQMSWAKQRGLPPLLAHFGVSIVERTMLDALARAHGVNLSTLLRENIPGINLGSIHGELVGRAPRDYLPEQPLTHVIARHTVGLSDPLSKDDLLPEDVLTDGLPQTLEDNIAFYGLHHFKLKVRGDLSVDVERLQQIAKIVTKHCGRNYAFTLDGNEQYREFSQFMALWERIQSIPDLVTFFEKLIFIEQPLYRSVALDPKIVKIHAWRDAPPMIIDESDAEIDSLARALALGYIGTSHKNCKGIMKSVAHRCLINHRNAIFGTQRYHMSGEDLVNIGPVALLQDLAVQAALGNATVERNGHHYFRGLSMFPEHISVAVLKNHGDLYTPFAGTARLQINAGTLRLGSVNEAPFGVKENFAMEHFELLSVNHQADQLTEMTV